VGKPLGMWPLGRLKRRYDNIEMDLNIKRLWGQEVYGIDSEFCPLVVMLNLQVAVPVLFLFNKVNLESSCSTEFKELQILQTETWCVTRKKVTSSPSGQTATTPVACDSLLPEKLPFCRQVQATHRVYWCVRKGLGNMVILLYCWKCL
jgi:hypothetical protein